MKISLDYDDTYTKDPDLWNAFIARAHQEGHSVYCITMRFPHPSESADVECSLRNKVVDIIYTSRRAKQEYLETETDIKIDVWIDDRPNFILFDARH